MYTINFDKVALQDIAKLKRTEPQAYEKFRKLLVELEEHPRSGTGKPERLKHLDAEIWSRRITQKHRLVYTITGQEIIVVVLAAYGHYKD